MIPIGPAPVMSTSSPRTGNAERRVHGVAERVEDGGDVEVDVGAMPPHVRGGQGDVLGVGARVVDTDALCLRALHAPPRNAVAAPAAYQMSLPAHEVADRQLVNVGTKLDDLADELVADYERDGDVGLGPVVPVVDVQVRTAHTRPKDLYEDIGAADSGDRHVFVAEPRSGLALTRAFISDRPLDP